MKHIIKTQTFTKDFLNEIFDLTEKMKEIVKKGGSSDLKGKIVATWFSEESTRTRLSFESAAMRLGGNVISTTNAKQFSSVSKGETLEDTVRVLQKYCDCIVMRHHEEGASSAAAHISEVPVINAGDGKGQHPTQSILDLYTIKSELGSIDNLSVALLGDLKNGRTVHSLAYLFGKFTGVELFLISPENLRMPQDILLYLQKHNVKYNEFNDLEKVLDKIDVLYNTRIQKERFSDLEEYEQSRGKLIITREMANRMKTDSIILHPLPRVDEIRYSVDDNHRAKYFKQAENGLYTRMALLKYLLE